MILATVDTGSYSWTALGETEGDAVASLTVAFAKHCEQVPEATLSRMLEFLFDGSVNFYPIEAGTVLRDGSPII